MKRNLFCDLLTWKTTFHLTMIDKLSNRGKSGNVQLPKKKKSIIQNIFPQFPDNLPMFQDVWGNRIKNLDGLHSAPEPQFDQAWSRRWMDATQTKDAS